MRDEGVHTGALYRGHHTLVGLKYPCDLMPRVSPCLYETRKWDERLTFFLWYDRSHQSSVCARSLDVRSDRSGFEAKRCNMERR